MKIKIPLEMKQGHKKRVKDRDTKTIEIVRL